MHGDVRVSSSAGGVRVRRIESAAIDLFQCLHGLSVHHRCGQGLVEGRVAEFRAKPVAGLLPGLATARYLQRFSVTQICAVVVLAVVVERPRAVELEP